MSAPLRDYQRHAVDHLHAHPRGALFMDMGLGKTATVLSALTTEHLPALVVAPKRVAENVWGAEVEQWRPDLRVSVASGVSRSRRSLALTSGSDIVVVGRDVLEDALDVPRPWRTVVLDESSGFKSRSTRRWAAARRLTLPPGKSPWEKLPWDKVPHVWALTGTPSPNGLMDLWAQMALIDAGQRLETSLSRFRAAYFTAGRRLPNGVVSSWDLIPGAAEVIQRRLADVCFTLTSEGRLDLPETLHNRVEVPLSPATRAVYRRMKKDRVVALDLLGGRNHSAKTVAALSNRLRQITAGILYPDTEDSGQPPAILHNEKARAVAEIVEGTGSPVIVFYAYLAERDAIEAALPRGSVYGPDTPDLQRRWNAGDIPVLLAHPGSIGHGLNLQKGPGHTIVWSSLTWSLEEWLQSNKRLARSGQEASSVTIHHLVSPDTVDEVVWDALMAKRSIQDALLDYLESPL